MTCLCVFFVSIKTAACSFSILDIIQNNKKQESIVIVYLYNDELKTMNLNQFTTNSKWNHFKRRRTPIDDCVSMLSLATNAANSVFICYHRKRLGINFEIGGGEDTKTPIKSPTIVDSMETIQRTFQSEHIGSNCRQTLSKSKFRAGLKIHMQIPFRAYNMCSVCTTHRHKGVIVFGRDVLNSIFLQNKRRNKNETIQLNTEYYTETKRLKSFSCN